MITGMEMAACQHLAVPTEVMQHVVNVESGYNPFAIGVVGGQLVRQPQNLGEAIATAQMLESKGYNYSLGLAQVNRSNLSKYGLTTYQQAFDICPNLTAGARILSECYASSGNDWGKSFSCYYSGNFVTGYRDGYVQKIFDSINSTSRAPATDDMLAAVPIQLANGPSPSSYGSNNLARAAVVAPDDASYRLAIRSSALDTAAALATKPLVASPPAVGSVAATAQAPSATASTTDTVAKAQAADAQPASNNEASADVFEPQVRALGDPPAAAAVASNDPSKKVAAATSPATPAGDSADVRQGGQDDALVF